MNKSITVFEKLAAADSNHIDMSMTKNQAIMQGFEYEMQKHASWWHKVLRKTLGLRAGAHAVKESVVEGGKEAFKILRNSSQKADFIASPSGVLSAVPRPADFVVNSRGIARKDNVWDKMRSVFSDDYSKRFKTLDYRARKVKAKETRVANKAVAQAEARVAKAEQIKRVTENINKRAPKVRADVRKAPYKTVPIKSKDIERVLPDVGNFTRPRAGMGDKSSIVAQAEARVAKAEQIKRVTENINKRAPKVRADVRKAPYKTVPIKSKDIERVLPDVGNFTRPRAGMGDKSSIVFNKRIDTPKPGSSYTVDAPQWAETRTPLPVKDTSIDDFVRSQQKRVDKAANASKAPSKAPSSTTDKAEELANKIGINWESAPLLGGVALGGGLIGAALSSGPDSQPQYR